MQLVNNLEFASPVNFVFQVLEGTSFMWGVFIQFLMREIPYWP